MFADNVMTGEIVFIRSATVRRIWSGGRRSAAWSTGEERNSQSHHRQVNSEGEMARSKETFGTNGRKRGRKRMAKEIEGSEERDEDAHLVQDRGVPSVVQHLLSSSP